MYKAIIFDMDGLLIDSEKLCLSSFNDSCRDFGFVVDLSVYYSTIGANEERARDILSGCMASDVSFSDFMIRWETKYEEKVSDGELVLKNGVTILLNLLDELGIPSAVATSSSYLKAIAKLEKMGILGSFGAVVGGDQVERSKPHPDIYIYAARALGVDPEKCLALEDSDNGVRSALAAGMRVIQVPDLVGPSKETRKLGHMICPSLADVVRYVSSCYDRTTD